jgi:hypothetical protein
MTLPSQVIAVTIQRPYDEVRAALAEPWTWPQWASGLAAGLEQDGETWIGRAPDGGKVRIRFCEPNGFGVADHWVTLPGGGQVYAPLRAVPNGDGAEVQFTLFRQPGMDEAAFARDAEWVRRDLEALRRLLEDRSRSAG